MNGHTNLAVAWCETHAKLSYTHRARARAIARRHSEHKSVYRCSANENLWHIGRLPESIRHGHISKDEYFGEAV